MSSVYSLEPPTSGKVILKTNFGNIDIELFTKETPRTCRNFIQHCMNGYYNKNVFFRIIKNFMIQTGDPTNTGKGGSSIWEKEFGDEFHSRLKFSHRGIVAMANKNKANTNGSQFFITMDKCPWLDKKHTIFGKVVGETFFNALNISELPTNKNDYPDTEMLPMIMEVQVIVNPFENIIVIKKETKEDDIVKEEIKKTVDDYNKRKIQGDHRLISFGEYNEEDNATNIFTNENKEEDKKEEKIEEKEEEQREEEESVSLSESDEEVIKAKEKFKEEIANKKMIVDSDRKEEIKRLKNDILTMKKKINKESNKETNEKEIKLTPLQQYNQRFLQYKTKRLSKEEQNAKILQFKQNLDNIKQNKKNSWMNNKLKFQIDSQKAYAIDLFKEQQQKNNNNL